jgi:hypothetical protein
MKYCETAGLATLNAAKTCSRKVTPLEHGHVTELHILEKRAPSQNRYISAGLAMLPDARQLPYGAFCPF